ncbi:glycoside hydrolase family 3 N-terminal domain-containing protein [Pinibacter aurantiacus]|uniref:Glycoside hydrolase family 3 C-terminal domain-containing protein n=1 Tax=Pinibacter aurantiacus TaxID=2851599 RepID=A0A9E2SCI0_9BACT|nr:glycoside hydrolase family 3 N-terminal domain-containing protein [Pinibacter aurantiacus]MBV4359004.1 glycoside hydrolase family 3 C-terminal domain-containing protein [Pinibacter aurantiacus]
MKKKLLFLFAIVPGLMLAQPKRKVVEAPLYKDAKAPIEARVKDLMKRMTLQEKVAQMQDLSFSEFADGKKIDADKMNKRLKGLSYGVFEGMGLTVEEYAQAINAIQHYMVENTRLGIPVFTSSEALHGCVHGGATIYPQAIALGSTFNPSLVNAMVKMIAPELKAQGSNQVLSPDLDLARELRWGRVEETYGEDPYLTGRMGVAFVKGFKDVDIVCTPKHFVAHGSPAGGLNLATVAGGERELRSIYLKPFEAVIKEAQPLSIMNAYSSYDRVPVAASHHILTDILRNELGFKGYVYSDWASVQMLYNFHYTAKDSAAAALQAVKAGLDLEVWSDCYSTLDSLVQTGALPVKYIDTAVARVLRAKFMIGLFENPYPEFELLKTAVHTPQSVQLALDIARESIVLMKNENGLLPFKSNIKSLAVIGPSADQVQFGDYTWTGDNKYGVTPLQGLRTLVGNSVTLNYAKGCQIHTQNKSGIAEAVAAAQKSDAAVIFVGSASASSGHKYPNATSGEGYDLTDLTLTGAQEDLIKAVQATGKPVVVVLVAGKPFAMPWVKKNIPAIVTQWYPGEQGGTAIAEVLFGKINPSGKLNVSFPQSVGHLPVYYNHYPSDKGYYHKPGSVDSMGRDYVFSSPDALWAFGTGLSYTNFRYSDMKVSKKLFSQKDTCHIEITVSNTGDMDGKEVVQLYVRDKVSSVETPVKELKRFEKVLIKKGSTTKVAFDLPISELSLYNADMQKVVEAGEYELQAGTASDNILLQTTITVK